MKLENLNIRHDMLHKLFLAKVKGGGARLAYTQPENKIMEFTETYVPKESRSKGVAGTLAEYALQFAEYHNFKVIPTCKFIKGFIKEHREFDDIIMKKA